MFYIGLGSCKFEFTPQGSATAQIQGNLTHLVQKEKNKVQFPAPSSSRDQQQVLRLHTPSKAF